MTPSSPIEAFIPRRFARLEEFLMSQGFDRDPMPREKNGWLEDPPLGLATIKGLWVPHADIGRDQDVDERVNFQIRERWTVHPE